MDSDFRVSAVRKAEDAFICRLLDSDKLYSYACTLLFKSIQKAKAVGLSNQHIQHIMEQQIVKTKFSTILDKPGLDCSTDTCSKLLKLDTYEAFRTVCTEANLTFTTLMGAFYKFDADNLFTLRCLEHDPALKAQFLKTCQTYFSLPSSVSFNQLKRIVGHTKGKWFYLFVMAYMNRKTDNLIRHHLQNEEDYIRQRTGVRLNKTVKRSNLNLIPVKRSFSCKRSELKQYTVKNIVRGSTFYKVTNDGIWSRLMKRFKKEVLSGPSGSSVITYQIVFQIAKLFPETELNKTMLLLCLLADYYHFHHSISEILQEYSAEAGFPDYRLNQNDLHYVQTLMRKANISLR
jgi:hypothetical protein